MDRIEQFWPLHCHLPGASVVIHNLHVIRIALTPREADAPSVVDANAVRPCAAAFQQFQLVSGRHPKILQPQCPVQIQQLPPRRPFDGLKSPDPAVLKERRGIRTLERPYQAPVYDAPGIMSNVIAECGAPRVHLHRSAQRLLGGPARVARGSVALALEERSLRKTEPKGGPVASATKCPTFDTIKSCGRSSSIPKRGRQYAAFRRRREHAWVGDSSGCRWGSRLVCRTLDQCQLSLLAFRNSG